MVEVKLIRDKHTGFPAGYGFVEFATAEIAEKVLGTCNGNAIGRLCDDKENYWQTGGAGEGQARKVGGERDVCCPWAFPLRPLGVLEAESTVLEGGGR